MKTLENVDLGQLYTFKETMQYLRISRSTLWRLMRDGAVCGRKVGSTWRFKKEDLDQALKATTEQPTEQREQRV